MRPPPTLVPRGLRLGNAALARTPLRREPAQVRGPASRPRKAPQALDVSMPRQAERQTEQNEATTASTEDAEMLDIPAEEFQDIDMGLDFVGSLEPARDDFIGQILLQQMGAGRSYIREKRQAVRRILVSEI